MFVAIPATPRKGVDLSSGASFNAMVPTASVTPAEAIPTKTCNVISNGNVREWRSGRVVKIQPRITSR